MSARYTHCYCSITGCGPLVNTAGKYLSHERQSQELFQIKGHTTQIQQLSRTDDPCVGSWTVWKKCYERHWDNWWNWTDWTTSVTILKYWFNNCTMVSKSYVFVLRKSTLKCLDVILYLTLKWLKSMFYRATCKQWMGQNVNNYWNLCKQPKWESLYYSWNFSLF